MYAPFDRSFAVAPMLDWTDRHCRYFLRLLSPHVVLYTEMVTTGALLYGDKDRFLRFHPVEHPLALQLGGSVPQELATCARLGQAYGYDEINLNVGCPSDRVQSGRFGACLMAEPELVAAGVAAMRAAVDIPVTVKTRIGIDEQDSYPELCHFIGTVAAAGCETFIIHARKAWLKGLSPKENREIPPLRYDIVRQLTEDFPQATFVLNGGIKTVAEVNEHLQHFAGVMIGREAYHNPYLLAEIEAARFGIPSKSRDQILAALFPYIEAELTTGIPLKHITRHLLGLYQGQPGARAWRRYISEHAHLPGAGIEVLQKAQAQLN